MGLISDAPEALAEKKRGAKYIVGTFGVQYSEFNSSVILLFSKICEKKKKKPKQKNNNKQDTT